MLILVPIPALHAGVEVGETVALLSLDMAVVKSISEVVFDDNKNQKQVGNTLVTYHNGSQQYINIKYTKILTAILNTTSITVVEQEGIERASDNVYTLLEDRLKR